MPDPTWEEIAQAVRLGGGEMFATSREADVNASECADGQRYSRRARLLIILALATSAWGLFGLVAYPLIRLARVRILG